MGFLEEQLSDGLEKMQVRGPKAMDACVEKFRVITIILTRPSEYIQG
jgi:hypothetical protein